MKGLKETNYELLTRTHFMLRFEEQSQLSVQSIQSSRVFSLQSSSKMTQEQAAVIIGLISEGNKSRKKRQKLKADLFFIRNFCWK